MSTSYGVHGIKPAGDKWHNMKAVYEACIFANVEVPKTVWDFFGNEEPDDLGVKVKLEPIIEHGDGECNYIIDLTKIDKNIQLIVFSASW